MPIYEYECSECGHLWEWMGLYADRPDAPRCPRCGQPSRRMLMAAHVRVRGWSARNGYGLRGGPDKGHWRDQ